MTRSAIPPSCANTRGGPCAVPPSPGLLTEVYSRFLELRAAGLLPAKMTFDERMTIDVTLA